MEWIDVNERGPNDEELRRSRCWDFLCIVYIPAKGGGYSREQRILKWDKLDKQWACQGMIVTHFRELPAFP